MDCRGKHGNDTCGSNGIASVGSGRQVLVKVIRLPMHLVRAHAINGGTDSVRSMELLPSIQRQLRAEAQASRSRSEFLLVRRMTNDTLSLAPMTSS